MVGLLPRDHLFFMEEAYGLYRARAALRTDADRREHAERVGRFRQTHACRGVTITLLGVFDTVGALGIPVGIAGRFNRRYRFHHVKLAPTVERAFHALAIDEMRKPFRPALWQLDAPRHPDVFEQRWFAGVHTNVGGGYDADGLANIPLHWLQGRASAAGLEFDEPFLAHYRPFHGDELRDSFTIRYRLLGRYRRPIGAARNGNGTVDATAIMRLRERRDGYAPPNLIEYCRRTGVSIA